MSWQPQKAVPLLAGEAFCEKPPLTYWIAAAAIESFGTAASAARLPNLLYALITALSVGLLARRSAGPIAGLAAAAAIGTFLLSYQVAIWLATDAPLLAAGSVALLGAYIGFYADGAPQRLAVISLMHAALALGFLSKSAAAWMVPALALMTLADLGAAMARIIALGTLCRPMYCKRSSFSPGCGSSTLALRVPIISKCFFGTIWSVALRMWMRRRNCSMRRAPQFAR